MQAWPKWCVWAVICVHQLAVHASVFQVTGAFKNRNDPFILILILYFKSFKFNLVSFFMPLYVFLFSNTVFLLYVKFLTLKIIFCSLTTYAWNTIMESKPCLFPRELKAFPSDAYFCGLSSSLFKLEWNSKISPKVRAILPLVFHIGWNILLAFGNTKHTMNFLSPLDLLYIWPLC